MKFNTIFVGGPLDKQMASVVIVSGKFEVGMTFLTRGHTYKVLDGPIAQGYEIKQKFHPNLAVRSEFVENGDETAEILADTEFANDLRKSIKQADAGDTIPWEKVKVEMGLREEFKKITEKERSKGRSENYHSLTPEEQWAEDKELGILDWDGE